MLYGEESLTRPSLPDFFGHIHVRLKSTTKRNEFTRSLEKRTAHAIENGVDVSNELVQARLFIDAYKDANRSIFLQDNRVVEAYKAVLQRFEAKSKVTGETPLSGKSAATALRVLLPIVKVPTNIVAETLQYSLGTVTGSARLAKAFYKGVETLKPEEADLIMRELKKGSLGAAVMLAGYFNPDMFGGYYQRGERRKAGDVKYGTVRLWGHDVPSFLIHNPLLETAQIGATIRRVSEQHISKKDHNQKGLGEGIYAGAMGLTEEVPFVREMAEVLKAFDTNQKGAFWGELGKSLMVPQALQWAAQHYDTDAQGNPVKRAPKTIAQHIETGIPVLRKEVPVYRKK